MSNPHVLKLLSETVAISKSARQQRKTQLHVCGSSRTGRRVRCAHCSHLVGAHRSIRLAFAPDFLLLTYCAACAKILRPYRGGASVPTWGSFRAMPLPPEKKEHPSCLSS